MNKILAGTMAALTLVLHSCSSEVYNNKAYADKSNLEGKKVAILPVEVELTGNLPKGMTNAKKSQLEYDESRMIQSQIYGQYLYRSKKDKKKKGVEFLNVDHVNGMLLDKGVDLKQAWTMDPDSLGRLIGADLVLKVKVKKDRIMSETASLGIGVAGAVLDNLISKKADNTNTSVTTAPKTYNLFLDATLSDVVTHTVVTKFSHTGDANWNRSSTDVIESSGRKIVRKGIVYAKN